MKLKGDKTHPHAQFLSNFLDPYLCNQGWLSLPKGKMAKNSKMQLKKSETIQRKENIVKIINTARETRGERATLKQEQLALQDTFKE